MSLALLFLIHGKNYPIGNLAKIEFGFFPLLIAVICFILSVLLFFTKDNDR